METYAVASIDPDRKGFSRIDTKGGVFPTWNDKVVFMVTKRGCCMTTLAPRWCLKFTLFDVLGTIAAQGIPSPMTVRYQPICGRIKSLDADIAWTDQWSSPTISASFQFLAEEHLAFKRTACGESCKK